MNLADELLKLEELRQSGALSNDEFEIAKRRVLENNGTVTSDKHFASIRLQNEVAQLDREWQFEREQYKVTGQYGVRSIPTRGRSVVSGLAVIVFGMVWTVLALFMAGMGAFLTGWIPLLLFPLFGIVFICVGAFMSLHSFTKAGEYEAACDRYRSKRAELIRRQAGE